MDMACTASVAVSCCPACGWRAGGTGSSSCSNNNRARRLLPAGNAGLRNTQLQGLALAASPGRKTVPRSGANGTGLVVEARQGFWFDLQEYEEQHGEVTLADTVPGDLKASSAAVQPVPVPGAQEALEALGPETSDRVLSGVGEHAAVGDSGTQENGVPTISGEVSSVLEELEITDPEPGAKVEGEATSAAGLAVGEEFSALASNGNAGAAGKEPGTGAEASSDDSAVSGSGSAEEEEEKAVASGGLSSGNVAVAGGLSTDGGQDGVVVSPGADAVEAAVEEVRISFEEGSSTNVLATGEEAVAGAGEEGNEDSGLVGEVDGSQEIAEATVVGEVVVTEQGKGLVEGDAPPGEASVGDEPVEPSLASADQEPAEAEELETEEQEGALEAISAAVEVAKGTKEPSQPSAREEPVPTKVETKGAEGTLQAVAAAAVEVLEGTTRPSQPSAADKSAEPLAAEELATLEEPENILELSEAAVVAAEAKVQSTETSAAEEAEQESESKSEDTVDQIQIVPTKVYVGGLPFTLQGKQLKSGLKRVFEKYGEVKGLQIVPFFSEGKMVKGRHRGFVFVMMDSAESAQAAIENLDGQVNLGRLLTVRQGVLKPASMKEAETPQPRKRQSQIFVANLCKTLSDEDLENAFKPYGTITHTRVITDYATGRSKGFGFVTYENEESAKAAIAALDGSQLGQTTMRVSFNKQPSAKST